MNIAAKNRRKHKQPSVSLCDIDTEYREIEHQRYVDNPNIKMPIMIPVRQLEGTIEWPKIYLK